MENPHHHDKHQSIKNLRVQLPRNATVKERDLHAVVWSFCHLIPIFNALLISEPFSLFWAFDYLAFLKKFPNHFSLSLPPSF